MNINIININKHKIIKINFNNIKNGLIIILIIIFYNQ